MKKAISKTEHFNNEGWLLTAKEVEDKVKEKLGFQKEHIIRIYSYEHNVITVNYTDEPLLIKKDNFFYEQDVKEKKVHINKEEFLSWFGIKPIENKDIEIENRLKFQGKFIDHCRILDKELYAEEDSFYLFRINDYWHENIEEVKDEI